MLINGRNRSPARCWSKTSAPKVTIEPIRGLAVLKDLIVDMDPFMDDYKSVLPYLINDSGEPEKERLPVTRGPRALRRHDEMHPVRLRARPPAPMFWGDGSYVGPAAIVNAHRFIFDSRDEAGRERMKILSEKTGVFRCRTTFNCTDACPRGIKVTKAIQEVKRAILFERF